MAVQLSRTAHHQYGRRAVELRPGLWCRMFDCVREMGGVLVWWKNSVWPWGGGCGSAAGGPLCGVCGFMHGCPRLFRICVRTRSTYA